MRTKTTLGFSDTERHVIFKIRHAFNRQLANSCAETLYHLRNQSTLIDISNANACGGHIMQMELALDETRSQLSLPRLANYKHKNAADVIDEIWQEFQWMDSGSPPEPTNNLSTIEAGNRGTQTDRNDG